MEASINAHMPGLVARVVVAEGARIAVGQEVAVINCMKNELSCFHNTTGSSRKSWSRNGMKCKWITP